MMTTGNDNNSRKTNSELKEVILDLFEQVRQANARNAEKDRMIASLTATCYARGMAYLSSF